MEGFKEVSILRDSVTGTSRGCAFAVYDSKQHAEEAIDKLNKQLTLPGGTQPMEVGFQQTRLLKSVCPAPLQVYQECWNAIFAHLQCRFYQMLCQGTAECLASKLQALHANASPGSPVQASGYQPIVRGHRELYASALCDVSV